MQTLKSRHIHDVPLRLGPITPDWSGRAGAAVRRELLHATRRFDAGEEILFEGDCAAVVLIVLDGWLALNKSLPEGDAQTIDFVLPGDLEIPMTADGASSAFEVVALTPARVAFVGAAGWLRMKDDMPALEAYEMHSNAAAQARRSERMLRLGRASAEMRVAYALMELCIRVRAGSATGCGEGRFHIPLTQQQLGDFVGLSAVHICRTLRRFVRAGVLTTEDHMDIGIQDLPALAHAAGIDIGSLTSEILPALDPA